MKAYFQLQFKMMNRRFKDTGINPAVGYFVLAIGFIVISFYLFFKTIFAQYVYLFLALSFISRLSEKERNEFLKICFADIQFKKTRITENLICAVPFLVFLLFKQLFLTALLLVVLTIIVALVHFRTSFRYTLWTPFSKQPFEFSTGFRNTIFLLLAAYLLFGVSVVVNNFNLNVFAMLLVFITTMSYYSKPENEYYVWSYSLRPKEFLFNKIKTAILFSSLLALPILVASLIVSPEHIGILLLAYVIGMAFLVAILLGKYAAYPHEMSLALGILFALCIWFPPLLVVLIPFLFKKSENSLSRLLK